MKKSILKTLQSTIQGDVFSQKEFRKFYSVDASSYQIIPKVVVIPKNEKDVINAVKIAKKNSKYQLQYVVQERVLLEAH